MFSVPGRSLGAYGDVHQRYKRVNAVHCFLSNIGLGYHADYLSSWRYSETFMLWLVIIGARSACTFLFHSPNHNLNVLVILAASRASHVEYAPKDGTDRQTDVRQTVTSRFTSVKVNRHLMCKFMSPSIPVQRRSIKNIPQQQVCRLHSPLGLHYIYTQSLSTP